ncbi:hypothetical protein GXW82_44105 [Streptacidiphilus sp. 4-A2]|nr:hypothetical protein [Streptacidiphilus sp. 4-A2]
MTVCSSAPSLFPDQLTDALRERFVHVPRSDRPKHLNAATVVLRLISSQLDEDTFTLFIDAAAQAANETTSAPGSGAPLLNVPAFTTRLGAELYELNPAQQEFKTSWQLLLAVVNFLPADEVAPFLHCSRSAWRDCLAMAKESADRAAPVPAR